MTIDEFAQLLEDLLAVLCHIDQQTHDLIAVLTRIAKRLDDEADRREEIFRLPDPEVTP